MDDSYDDHGKDSREELREQDRFLPIANVARIMKKGIPENGKVCRRTNICLFVCFHKIYILYYCMYVCMYVCIYLFVKNIIGDTSIFIIIYNYNYNDRRPSI